MAKDSSVNIQNFPTHENKEIRDIVIAPKGYLLVAIDEGQLEARLIGMSSKDPVLCGDIWLGGEEGDTHLKWTKKIAEEYPRVLKKLSIKELRGDVKMNFVFASFYGSSRYSVVTYYNSTYGIPERIISDLHDEFWDTYKGVKKWQDSLIDFYNKHNYIESLTGRRRHAPLSISKIINFPIQSVGSFDVCIGAGNRLSKMVYKLNKPQLQYRINVHDELVMCVPETTVENDMYIIAKEMVNPLWDWVTVPFSVECSIGKNWGSLDFIKEFSTLDFWGYKNNKWVEKSC